MILAGGGGTRLWPRSRTKTPKQFLRLVGEKTMLQLTAERARQLVPWDHIVVVTNCNQVELVKAQLPQLKPAQIILEPDKKDTALAMLVGTLYVYSLDPEAVIINSASDHFVVNGAEFVKTMNAASKLAATNQYLLTVGIAPTRPETGFGYIKIGEEIGREAGLPVFKVDSFTEKPNATTAAAFIATGKYFWNANMYVWSAQALCASFAEHAPKIWSIAKNLAYKKGAEFMRALPAVYKKTEPISIDYAISEKATNLLLLPGDFGWSDVGDWKVVYQLGKKDLNRNMHVDETSGSAELLAVNSGHNLVSSNHGRLVALLGVDNLVVVDTPEILLVANQENSQEVKKIVEQLKAAKKKQYL